MGFALLEIKCLISNQHFIALLPVSVHLEVSSKEKVTIEIFHISSVSTHNKQQTGIKYLHRKKGGKVMTATNMCSNFGSKWCSLPLWLFSIPVTY